VLHISTTNGENHAVEVFYHKGHAKNRMSPAEVEAKFRACARGLLSEAQQTKVISLVRDLEKLPNIAELMNHLALT
jgi:2-methylcitrate dehydratase PrpD